MSTESIFHHIHIQDPEAAECFVSALEKAAELAASHPFQPIEYKEITRDNIDELLRKFKK